MVSAAGLIKQEVKPGAEMRIPTSGIIMDKFWK